MYDPTVDQAKAMADISPIERAFSQLGTDVDNLSNVIERLHNKLHGVLRKDDRVNIVTTTDPIHEGASDAFKFVDSNSYQVRCATDRLQYILDMLEV